MYAVQANGHCRLDLGREKTAINNVLPGIERRRGWSGCWDGWRWYNTVGPHCDGVRVPKPETLWRWKRRLPAAALPVEIDELIVERLADKHF
jgi:hypothetical protein